MRNEKAIKNRIKCYEENLKIIKEDVFDNGRYGEYSWSVEYKINEQLIKHLRWVLGEINLPIDLDI